MAVDKELSIFVRNLPVCPLPEMEELLYELFLQSGPVNKVFIPYDKETGAHRGYGFVEYMHVESVAYTCALMTDIKLFGKTLWVHPVKSSTNEDDSTCDEAIDQEDSFVPELSDNNSLDLSALDPNQAQLLQVLLAQAAANMLPPPPPPLPPLLPLPPLPLPCTSAPLLPPHPLSCSSLLPPPLPPHLLAPPPLLPGTSPGLPPPPPGFPSPDMANFSFSLFPPNLPPPLSADPEPAFPMTQAACFEKRRRKKANREVNLNNTYPTASWQTIT